MRLWFPRVIDTVSMRNVNARNNYSTLPTRVVLIAVFSCALTGCWEEIHYSPPETKTAKSANASIASKEAGKFADEVVDSIPGDTASAVGEPATEPADSAPPPAVTVAVASPEPAAPPVDAPAEQQVASTTSQSASTAEPARSTRRVAWSLGSNLSIAALANDRGAPADRVAAWYDTARQQAKLFEVELAPLPPRPAANAIDPQSTRAMDYLFAEGQTIGGELATQCGDDHAALFELALKSNLLLVRYEPGAPIVKSLSAAVSPAAERAKLPPELCAPLLKLLSESAPAKTVREAVFQLHDEVDHYLSTGTSTVKQ